MIMIVIKLTNLHHLAQFLQITSDQIKKGQLIKVLGSLVSHLNHLMVPL